MRTYLINYNFGDNKPTSIQRLIKNNNYWNIVPETAWPFLPAMIKSFMAGLFPKKVKHYIDYESKFMQYVIKIR